MYIITFLKNFGRFKKVDSRKCQTFKWFFGDKMFPKVHISSSYSDCIESNFKSCYSLIGTRLRNLKYFHYHQTLLLNNASTPNQVTYP